MNGTNDDDPRPLQAVHADPVLAELLQYWSGLCGSRRCPSRADIDPIDIPRLLPHIGLIDVENGGARFRYRLVGTNMNDIFGHDFTGEFLDDTKQGAYAGFLHDLYAETARERRPIFSETVFGYRDKRYLAIRRLILPLADGDDVPVGMLLFSNTFRPREAADTEVGGATWANGERAYRAEDIVDIRSVSRHRI